MPIRPENRKRYPPNWSEISDRIRFVRAGRMCECRGECGRDHAGDDTDIAWQAWLTEDGIAEVSPGRCTAVHDWPNPRTGSKVVLTVAHLNHAPEDCADENLRAMCQGCHLHYDREHHAQTAAATRRAAAEAQMRPLFYVTSGLDEFHPDTTRNP
ncbi:HNH endonuclease [Mycobacterium phage Philonius]|uniref:HNH endonuclease n=2 Tax=Caudoviricetes TaxID=2731619 RepID=A0A2H4PD52_9CAUD|nr:HNH endonuclease [Mycobacterium phage FirstPlacePfu]YP_010051925.1 HNH endonuclease [Mycobacterium phage Philonius]ATW60120.1 HNH endonuclease [Mycobacterium phage Philonius]QCG77725.1 HNH endonuclease [Mycobacterium phage FirstPlacePfu]